MKLIYCCHCQDVVKLLHHERHCDCGRCGGHYINQLHAVYWGDTAVPLGFDNTSFGMTLEEQPKGPGPSKHFVAFVIPKSCPTMAKIDPVNKIRLPDDSD